MPKNGISVKQESQKKPEPGEASGSAFNGPERGLGTGIP